MHINFEWRRFNGFAVFTLQDATINVHSEDNSAREKENYGEAVNKDIFGDKLCGIPATGEMLDWGLKGGMVA